MSTKNYLLLFLCLIFSSIFNLIDFYVIYPNLGGDSTRLYLYYFNEFLDSVNKSFDTNFPNRNYPYTNLIFFLIVNKYLSIIINDLFLYHLNNVLPLFLGLYGLNKLLQSFFNHHNDKKYFLFIFFLSVFYFCNKWTIYCLYNAGVWIYPYFLAPFFLYLFKVNIEKKSYKNYLIFLFFLFYYSIIFDLSNFGFLLAYSIFIIYFIMTKSEFIKKNYDSIFFILSTIIISLSLFFYNIYIYYSNNVIDFNYAFQSQFISTIEYIESYVHLIFPINSFLRLPEMVLNSGDGSNLFYSLNKSLYIFLYPISLLILLLILKGLFNNHHKINQKEIIIIIFIFLFSFIFSTLNFNENIKAIFYLIYKIPFSQSVRSFQSKFFIVYNISFFLLLIYSIKSNLKEINFIKIINFLISLYVLIFLFIFNLKNFESHNEGVRHSYGYLNDDFTNISSNNCRGNGFAMSFPFSQLHVIIDNPTNNSHYVGSSPFNIFCDKYHLYTFSHVSSYLDDYRNFLYNLSNNNIDYFDNLFKEKTVEQILVYKNLDKIIDSEFYIINFKDFKSNYDVENFISILNKIDYELIEEDYNFLYFEKSNKIKINNKFNLLELLVLIQFVLTIIFSLIYLKYFNNRK